MGERSRHKKDCLGRLGPLRSGLPDHRACWFLMSGMSGGCFSSTLNLTSRIGCVVATPSQPPGLAAPPTGLCNARLHQDGVSDDLLRQLAGTVAAAAGVGTRAGMKPTPDHIWRQLPPEAWLSDGRQVLPSSESEGAVTVLYARRHLVDHGARRPKSPWPLF